MLTTLAQPELTLWSEPVMAFVYPERDIKDVIIELQEQNDAIYDGREIPPLNDGVDRSKVEQVIVEFMRVTPFTEFMTEKSVYEHAMRQGYNFADSRVLPSINLVLSGNFLRHRCLKRILREKRFITLDLESEITPGMRAPRDQRHVRATEYSSEYSSFPEKILIRGNIIIPVIKRQ